MKQVQPPHQTVAHISFYAYCLSRASKSQPPSHVTRLNVYIWTCYLKISTSWWCLCSSYLCFGDCISTQKWLLHIRCCKYVHWNLGSYAWMLEMCISACVLHSWVNVWDWRNALTCLFLWLRWWKLHGMMPGVGVWEDVSGNACQSILNPCNLSLLALQLQQELLHSRSVYLSSMFSDFARAHYRICSSLKKIGKRPEATDMSLVVNTPTEQIDC